MSHNSGLLAFHSELLPQSPIASLVNALEHMGAVNEGTVLPILHLSPFGPLEQNTMDWGT